MIQFVLLFVASQSASAGEQKPFKFEIASPDKSYRLRFGLKEQLWAVYSDMAGPEKGGLELGIRRSRLCLSPNAQIL